MAEAKKLSKSTLNKVYWRHFQTLGCFSYERQEATGFAWMMMPAMRELYGDDPEKLKEGMKRHLEFFNCALPPIPFIEGITLAMEEQYASSEPGEFEVESINAVKTALMGPLAGIGDSFFWGTFRVIGVGVGAPLAIAGNPLGILLYALINLVPSTLTRVFGFKIGYEGGSNFLTKISEDGTLNRVTEAAKIMGLVVVGAMIASMVKVNVVTILKFGETTVDVKGVLNSIMPNLLPLLLTFGCYGLLQRKVKNTWILLGLLVLGIVGVWIGFLG